MDAKIIAATITQMADLAREGSISLELHGTVNAALWELATLKDLREEVDSILQSELEAELEGCVQFF
jgi:transcriptional regulator of acetoin/glycerol metabolism